MISEMKHSVFFFLIILITKYTATIWVLDERSWCLMKQCNKTNEKNKNTRLKILYDFIHKQKYMTPSAKADKNQMNKCDRSEYWSQVT